MRLTTGQRLEALERDSVVLHDTVKLLHKMLKDQGQLIHEYIVQRVGSANANDKRDGGDTRPEDALYTFVCKRRLDRIDRQIQKMHRLVEDLKAALDLGKGEAA